MNIKSLFQYFLLTTAFFLQSLSTEAQKPRVVATTTFLADMARNIAGDELEVISLLPYGGDPHIYDPRPGDITILSSADMILKNGLHLEGWLDKVIVTSGSSSPVINVSDGVEAIVSEQFHGAPDPHAWMVVTNGIIYCENITNAFATWFPDKAETFRTNFRIYKQRLLDLDAYIFKAISTIPEKQRILVTTHDAFRYYGNRYGLRVESIVGISTDAEIQNQDMDHVIQVIRENELPAIFVESTINPKVFLQISRDENVKIGGQLFADSVGDEESGANTYVDMIRHNTDVIVAALTGQSEGIFTNRTNFTLIWVVVAFFLFTFLAVAWLLRRKMLKLVNWENYSISISNLNVSYDRKSVLSNINLEMESGKMYGLIGPNGSGKSTLFKVLLGLVNPDSGSVTINNVDIKLVQHHIAYIPQKDEIDFNFPATVLDIVLHGRYPHKQVFSHLSSADLKLAEQALDKMQMLEFRNRQIGQLSGGQQQRVFLARALCQEAEIYLLDEPFVGVDVTTEERIIKLLKQLAGEGKTVIVIHHDLSEVKNYFNRVIMMNQTLIAFGETEKVFTDKNIQKTYGARPTILQQTDTFIY